MEKLKIVNFAGFKSIDLEILPITGLIGPEASGKSIVAKLLYFFREIASRLPQAVSSGQDSAEYKAQCRKRFSTYFPVEGIKASEFEISYQSGKQATRVKLSQNGGGGPSPSLDWDGCYDDLLEKYGRRKNELLGAVGDADGEAIAAVYRELHDLLAAETGKNLGPAANYEQFFIPAGRAFFSQIRNTLFTRLEEGESLDPFIIAFGSRLEASKSVLENQGFFGGMEGLKSKEKGRIAQMRSAFSEILHAQWRRSEKQDLLEFGDGRTVRLAQASSGQQEALPLLLLLARFFHFPHSRGRAVYIEEPEAHLFPATQKRIVELMAETFRERHKKMSLLITTHSPYIVATVNNLLQAGKLYSTASPKAAERLEKVIPRARTFNPGEVAFYALKNGSATPIVDAETGLIDAAWIDEVSNDIAIEFDNLLREGDEKS